MRNDVQRSRAQTTGRELQPPLYGCLEAGGTKFICAVGRPGEPWAEKIRVSTEAPDITISTVVSFLREAQTRHGDVAALGVASFGPIRLDPKVPDWGSILGTPKAGWSGVPLAKILEGEFGVPVGFDTDVNAAALAEASQRPRCEGLTLSYVTVGTGVGGGAVLDGACLHGRGHPEMGHVQPPRHPRDLEFGGTCSYHGGCTEGLASGPAILARWGRSLSELPSGHEAHDIVAWYLGHLAITILSILSPQLIVFGGGVMSTPNLLTRIRTHAARFSAGYLGCDDSIQAMIQASMLGEEAGLVGALLLAERAALGTR